MGALGGPPEEIGNWNIFREWEGHSEPEWKRETALSAELGKLADKTSLEGHTDARPYTGRSEYSTWELSVDRAKGARRLMEQNGVRAGQIVQIRGYADQRLRKPDKPEDLPIAAFP